MRSCQSSNTSISSDPMFQILLLLVAAEPQVTVQKLPQGFEVVATAVMPVGLVALEETLTDVGSYPRWMPYVTETKVLSTGPGTRREFVQFKFPWPIGVRAQVTDVVITTTVLEFCQSWVTVDAELPAGLERSPGSTGSWTAALEPGGLRVTYRALLQELPGPEWLLGPRIKAEAAGAWKAVETEALRRKS